MQLQVFAAWSLILASVTMPVLCRIPSPVHMQMRNAEEVISGGNRGPQPVDQRFTLFFLMDDPEIYPSILRYPMVLANHLALMDSQCITVSAFSSLFLLP